MDCFVDSTRDSFNCLEVTGVLYRNRKRKTSFVATASTRSISTGAG